MTKPLRVLSLFLLTLYSAAAHAQSGSGLIAHWMLNGNGADSSGNGLHGIVYGATPDTGRNMKPASAMRFDGKSYIQIPYDSAFNTQRFSIAAIVKLEAFNQDVCGLNTVFWRGNEFMDGCYSMVVFDNAFDSSCNLSDTGKNVFAGSISTNTHQTHTGWQYNPTVRSQRWYSAVLSYDGTYARVYVNGVLMATNRLGNPVGTATDGALIGMRYFNNGAYPYPWTGLIDDIQLYNRVLADSEILAYHYYDTVGSSLSVPPQPAASLNIYPNPATDMLHISAPGMGETDIVIVNALGQIAHREHGVQSLVQIPTGSWPRGHYVVRVSGRGLTVNKKIVLQ